MKHHKKLYILPFDHRGSFMKMFGVVEATMTHEQFEMLKDAKHLIYEAFLAALEMGVPKEYAGLLVDEQFGTEIHREAQKLGVIRILTTEKSGQDEFDFEYGDEFGAHIDALKPDYVKVLVRYNPDGDAELNKRQRDRLKVMNDFCHTNGYGFLFELLATPTEAQMQAVGGKEGFEKMMQGEMMVRSMQELQESGIEPDVWKLEGLADMSQMQKVVAQARSEDRSQVGVIVLGRGESEDKVRVWLKTASQIEGVTGFAVGRTVFKEPMMAFHEKKLDRPAAIQKISENYKSWVDLFEKG